MTQENRTFQDELRDVLDDLFDLMVERQRKYGSKNIEQGGILGCAIRAGDKVERLKQAFPTVGAKKPIATFSDETAEDAMLDEAAYGIIALMLYRGVWGRPLAEPYITISSEVVLDPPPSEIPYIDADSSDASQGWRHD